MTLVFGFALDPETGDPLDGREVSADLLPFGVDVDPIDGGTDRTFTGVDGGWQLILPPTAGSGAYFRIREWMNRTYYVDVPNTTHDTDVTTIEISPANPPPPPPPSGPSLYITRAERGQPDGVASLDASGKVPLSELPGSAGGQVDQVLITGIAAVDLSGHRIVTTRSDGTLEYASNDNSAHISAPLWMTTGAALAGDEVTLLAFGEFTESSWSWTAPGPLYLGQNGVITQTAPVVPATFLTRIGNATEATSIFFDRSPSIKLI